MFETPDFKRVAFLKITYIPIKIIRCEGWDSNPRNPSIPDLKSGAFDQLGDPRMKNKVVPDLFQYKLPHN